MRELLVGVLVEPSLILVLFVMAVAAGSTNVGLMASSVANLTACPFVAVVVAGVACAAIGGVALRMLMWACATGYLNLFSHGIPSVMLNL